MRRRNREKADKNTKTSNSSVTVSKSIRKSISINTCSSNFPTGAEISMLLRDIGDISDNDIYENNKSSSSEHDSN